MFAVCAASPSRTGRNTASYLFSSLTLLLVWVAVLCSSKTLWVVCPGHAGVKANDRADRLAGKATFTNGLLLGRSEAWDTTCGHKVTDIAPSIAWKREAWKEEALDDLPWKDERGPSSMRRTWEPFQRQRWGKLLRDGVERIWAFPSAKRPSWTELNWTVVRAVVKSCELQRHDDCF